MPSSQQTSVLCPNCRTLVSVQATQCLHCGIRHPASWWKHTVVTRGLRDPHTVMQGLMAINIGMYVIALLLDVGAVSQGGSPLRFLSPSTRSLLLLGATGTFPLDHFARWWTLVSASYLHGGLLHLAFNMMALRQLLPLIAHEYGTARMVALYTLTGILGFAVSYLVGIRLTLGASAAVCGLIGAALYYGKRRGGIYGRTIYRQIGGWAIGIFVFGFFVPGINNWAHGGGMVAGVLLGFLLGYDEHRREQLWHKLLAHLCVVVTVAILAWAIVSGVLYGAAA